MNTTIKNANKANFFKHFKVHVDSLASQTLEYQPESDSYDYTETDVYGETQFVRLLDDEESDNILDIEHTDENAFVDEMVEAFENVNRDVAKFIEVVQAKYEDQNKI